MTPIVKVPLDPKYWTNDGDLHQGDFNKIASLVRKHGGAPVFVANIHTAGNYNTLEATRIIEAAWQDFCKVANIT